MTWIRPGLSEIWRLIVACTLLFSALTVLVLSGGRTARDIYRDFMQELPTTYWPYTQTVNIGYSAVGLNGHAFNVPFSFTDNPSGGSSPGNNPESDMPGYAHVLLTISDISPSSSKMHIQLAVALDPWLAQHLNVKVAGRFSALNLSNSRQWENLPISVYLLPCILDLSNPACTSTSMVQIPLGELLNQVRSVVLPAWTQRTLLPAASRQVDLYANSAPSAYPQDTYSAILSPVIILPPTIKFTFGKKSATALPVSLRVMGGSNLLDKSVVIRTGHSSGYQVVVSRRGVDQAVVYAMSLIPFFLGFIIFCVTLGRRGLESWIQVLIGFLAVWLTILPLRLVLVPQELGDTPLTRVDDMLIFDAAAVFFFIAVTFARVVIPIGRAKSRDQANRLSLWIEEIEEHISDLESQKLKLERSSVEAPNEEPEAEIDEPGTGREKLEAKLYYKLETELNDNISSLQAYERRKLKILVPIRNWFYGDRIVGWWLDAIRDFIGCRYTKE